MSQSEGSAPRRSLDLKNYERACFRDVLHQKQETHTVWRWSRFPAEYYVQKYHYLNVGDKGLNNKWL